MATQPTAEHLNAAALDMYEALVELDALRADCSPDELGAIAGKRVEAFVQRYRAALAKAKVQTP